MFTFINLLRHCQLQTTATSLLNLFFDIEEPKNNKKNKIVTAMAEELSIEPRLQGLLEPYLPSTSPPPQSGELPFVTLTFATSLDSSLSLAPGVRTALSGPESKAMTHYLRSRHGAILVGISTLLADNPGLNCRIAGAVSQPRPIIIDPNLRWTPSESDKVLQLQREGRGLAPFVLTAVAPADLPAESVAVLEAHDGKFIYVEPRKGEGEGEGDEIRLRFDWRDILATLRAQGLHSVMVEGGGQIINSLLDPTQHSLISSVIVTIAPVWLGQGGVVVSPNRVSDDGGNPLPAARLRQVLWHPFGEDVVLCGKLT